MDTPKAPAEDRERGASHHVDSHFGSRDAWTQAGSEEAEALRAICQAHFLAAPVTPAAWPCRYPHDKA